MEQCRRDLFNFLEHFPVVFLLFEFLFQRFVINAWFVGVKTAGDAKVLMFNTLNLFLAIQDVQ